MSRSEKIDRGKYIGKSKLAKKIDITADRTTCILSLTSLQHYVGPTSRNQDQKISESTMRSQLCHTVAMHQWILKKSISPICNCGKHLTIQHILNEVQSRSNMRRLIFGAHDIFKMVEEYI